MTSQRCGSLAGYKAGCRCLACKTASNRYESRRYRLRGYGLPATDLIDAEPVRQHVQALRTQAVGYRRIAELAGVPTGTLAYILYGRGRRVKSRIAEAILAVQPIPDLRAQVDATGTRRRLQALIAVGWTQRQLAQRVGATTGHFGGIVNGQQTKVEYRRALAVRELYDKLWNTQPDGLPSSTTRARRLANRRGWAPPGAWDDDTIDDPAAQPCWGELERRRGRAPIDLDEARHLLAGGEWIGGVAARVGAADAEALIKALKRDQRRRGKEGAA